ncbi:MAG: hypothetical protein PHE59_01935 [Patescibacteria group bacterium]|nr:hypothetical protein [Patescibacteria group bacterium]MDD5164105.1 hypothetical protein [Patescibacteria group bacterium]MDD5534237.1 hypothetical protein [Patescibacteria group bacterium]
MGRIEQSGENYSIFSNQEEIGKKQNNKENPISQNQEGQIFGSLSHSQEINNQRDEQQELMDNFDEILKEPREVLNELGKLVKKYEQKSVPELLWNIYKALNEDIKSKRLDQAENLIEPLKELRLHIFTKENFKNIILSGAKENHLIHLSSSKAFDRQAREKAQQEGRPLVQPAQQFEFYYHHWEADPETHKPVLQIDQYQFSGDPSSGAAKSIFYELSEYARLIEPLEKISYLREQYREKKIFQEAKEKLSSSGAF